MTSRQKYSRQERWQYWFDNLMAKGPTTIIYLLGIITILIIVVASFVVTLINFVVQKGGTDLDGFKLAWLLLGQLLNASLPEDISKNWLMSAMLLLMTLAGVFIISSIGNVLGTGLENELERLRKGRSKVLESNHTLILGWSPQIFTIISELMIANENQVKARIVVLADRDKVEMEDELRDRIEIRGSTRIIVRSGNPIEINDLEIASPHTAKSILILPPYSSDPDSSVFKTILAIVNNPLRRAEAYHIVTQIRDPENLDLIKMVSDRDNVQAILSGDFIARVITQTSRQSGLSSVYTELMNYGGDEIYFKYEPSLTGKSFGDALLAFEDSSLMGLNKPSGEILVNPPMDTIIETGDRIFALSEDDDTIYLSNISRIPIDEKAIRSNERYYEPRAEKCLILGWNRSGITIVRELDNYVAEGSLINIVADINDLEKLIYPQISGLVNQKVIIKEGDTTDRFFLNGLKIGDYDHIIVLAYSTLETQESDAKTLVTLFHLRDIAEMEERTVPIVSEMLDLRNRELAEVARVNDFIVSEHLMSLMMSQLSEDPSLFDVFSDIFDPEGSEIYLKPIGHYIALYQPVNFYTVVEAARRQGETAIGYRLASESSDFSRSYGIHTNPKKSYQVNFVPEDKIIVIAEKQF